MKINIEIEKIILNGFNIHDGRKMNIALQKELEKLIIENGLSKSLIPEVENDEKKIIQLNLPSNMNAKMIGEEIAHSIYRRLGNDVRI